MSLDRAMSQISQMQATIDIQNKKLEKADTDMKIVEDKMDKINIDAFDRLQSFKSECEKRALKVDKSINDSALTVNVHNSDLFKHTKEIEFLKERTIEVNERCLQIGTKLGKMEIEKSDTFVVKDKLDQLTDQIDKINNDLDTKEAKLLTVERFIDKYVPIRI